MLTSLVVEISRPAAADPVQSCSSKAGVIVVVDFSPWGGKVERGCDTTPTTGYEALHVAGFTTTGDDEDGPAFICRIDDEPPVSQDPCINTPPASAYWSYWHADAGQNTWTYTQQGAMAYKPPSGSVDAWVFGATNLSGSDGSPPFSPSQVRLMSGRTSLNIVDVHSSLARRSSGGSPLPFVTGAAVVVALGAVTGLFAWRRRRLSRGS